MGVRLAMILTAALWQSGCSDHEPHSHPDGIIGLSDSSITQDIQSSRGVLLVHFTSYDPGCGYCISSNAYINTLMQENAHSIQVARISWEPWTTYDTRTPEIAKTYWIRGLPMIVLYKDGKELWRGTGYTSENKNKLEQLISENRH